MAGISAHAALDARPPILPLCVPRSVGRVWCDHVPTSGEQVATTGEYLPTNPPPPLPGGSRAGTEGSTASAGATEPIEVRYRVTPAEIEQAVERTSARYVADIHTLFDRVSAEVGRLYEAQLAAKDQALAAQDGRISAQQETLAALRRRTEAAEAARDALRARLDAAQAVPAATEAPTVVVMAADTPRRPAGLWGRLWRALGARSGPVASDGDGAADGQPVLPAHPTAKTR